MTVEKQPSVEQIFYTHYGTQPDKHSNYFALISKIAFFIGSALEEDSRFRFSFVGHRREQQIRVAQAKEKFGGCRVYCELLGETDEEKLAAKQWYRTVYLDAKLLWPQYWKAIKSGADEEHLLCETPEELEESLSGYSAEESWFKESRAEAYAVAGWDVQKEEKASAETGTSDLDNQS